MRVLRLSSLLILKKYLYASFSFSYWKYSCTLSIFSVVFAHMHVVLLQLKRAIEPRKNFIIPGHYKKIMPAQQPIRACILLQPYNKDLYYHSTWGPFAFASWRASFSYTEVYVQSPMVFYYYCPVWLPIFFHVIVILFDLFLFLISYSLFVYVDYVNHYLVVIISHF